MAGLEANNIPRADAATTFIGSLLYRYIYFWGMYVVASNSHKLKASIQLPEVGAAWKSGCTTCVPISHLGLWGALPASRGWGGADAQLQHSSPRKAQVHSTPEKINLMYFGIHTGLAHLLNGSTEVVKSPKSLQLPPGFKPYYTGKNKNKDTTGPSLFGFFPEASKLSAVVWG